MPEFPSTLPLPSAQLGGNSETPQARTEMASGRKRQRLRFSSELKTYQFRWSFTSEEFDIFKAFVQTDLVGGTEYFEITLPLDGAEFEFMRLRFVEGKYGYTYKVHDTWEVSANLEAEPSIGSLVIPGASPVPVWYRPIVPLVSDLEANPLIHKNALFQSSPGAGLTHMITVPEIVTAGDRLPLGIELTGAGSVLIRTEGEDGGGGGPDPTFIETALANFPWALWDGSTVVQTSGSITQLTDLSGNSRNLTDAQTGTSRATSDGVHIVTAESGRSLSAKLPSGTFPAKFHAFILLKADADLIAEASDTFYVLSPFASTSSNSYWGLNIVSGTWRSVNAFAGGIRNTFRNTLDASKYILYEAIRDTNDQHGYVNGAAEWSSGGAFPDANMTWSGVRMGGQNNGFNQESALIRTIAVFDCTTAWLTRDQVKAIRESCFNEYPDTYLSPSLKK